MRLEVSEQLEGQKVISTFTSVNCLTNRKKKLDKTKYETGKYARHLGRNTIIDLPRTVKQDVMNRFLFTEVFIIDPV